MILANARILAHEAIIPRGWLCVRDGMIDSYGPGDPSEPADSDLSGTWLVPGFVDMHVHGAAGRSFDEADDESVDAIVRHHLARGTTTLIASLVSAPLADLERRLRVLSRRVADGTLAGIHLEGPFLSAARRGAHALEHLQTPTPEAVEQLLAAGGGAVRMMTIAPELPGALEAIAHLAQAGVVAAIGHTAADYETTQAAIAAGASVATHLYNGMPPLYGRDPGPVAALAHHADVTVELIADGFHLHPAVLRDAAANAANHFALVSDAIAATGVGDGEYLLGSQRVRVSDGMARLIDGDSLAGSTLDLAQALRTAIAAGVPLLPALRAVTAHPAHAVGLLGHAGVLATGRTADLVALDEHLTVRAVLHHGRLVTPHESVDA